MKHAILLTLVLILGYGFASADNYTFHWKPIHESFDSIVIEIEKQAMLDDDDREKFAPQVEELYRIAREQNNSVLTSRAKYWDAWVNIRKNQELTAELMNEALQLNDKLKYDYDYARIQMLQIVLYVNSGDYLNAYILLTEFLPYFQSKNDGLYLAYCNNNLGSVLFRLGEFEEAEEYLLKGIDYFEKAGLSGKAAGNKLNISNIYFSTNRQEEAIALLKTVVDNPSEHTGQYIYISCMVSLGGYTEDIEIVEGAYQKALEYGDPYLINLTLSNRAGLFSMLNKPDSAILFAKEVRNYAAHAGNYYLDERACQILSISYANKQQWDSAYHYMEQHQLSKEQIQGGGVVGEVQRIKSMEAIEKYKLQLEHSKRETQLQKRIVFILVSGILLVFTLSIVLIYLYRKRADTEKRLREIESKELNERLKNEMLEKEKFRLEIDSKNRELSSNTILLTTKNQVLKELRQHVDKLGSSEIEERKARALIKKKIEENLKTDDEWEYFKLHFDQVHPDFFNKLKESFPALTEHELRLCAYLRISLSTKQIAQMLSVMPKAVIQARYRMRKKMMLDDETLDDYLRNM